MIEAKFWSVRSDGKIECGLCPHRCSINEGRSGLCRVRRVVGGKLIAGGYGQISSAALDPIEKKPLYHFRPGSSIFSIGGWGCNFACRFCQNWTISQDFVYRGRSFQPEEVVGQAGCGGKSIGIAYTYNEPLISWEFVYDCAVLARKAGLANVLVTNGFVNPEPAAELLPLIDALNVDIKSMEDAFYRDQCRGRLQPVLDFCVRAVKQGCHVEITNLVIPGLNDREELFEMLSGWIKKELGQSTPLHLSAYFPQYKADAPPTPTSTLERAHEICSKHLQYVYIGNIMTAKGRDTSCPVCGNVLVRRHGYTVRVEGINNGLCAKCGAKADFVMVGG